MKKLFAFALFLAAAPLFAGMSSAAPVPEPAPEPIPLTGCAEQCHAEYLACKRDCTATAGGWECLENCTWDHDFCLLSC